MANCIECLEKARVRRAKNSQSKRSADPGPERQESRPRRRAPPADRRAETNFDDIEDLSEIPQDVFLATLEREENVMGVLARVREVELEGRTMRERADALAASIGASMRYRWIYADSFTAEKAPYMRFTYNCAQLKSRQHVSRKKAAKSRDKGSMATYDCDGWLHITVWPSNYVAWIKLKHEKDHVPYWSIDVPEDVQDYVRQNPRLKPHQLWDWVLKEHGAPHYDRKAIYRLWAAEDQKLWKRDIRVYLQLR
ncbi:hypothetical protein K523DRAFT_356711 [Schizophyllum commune Tattone D]|nr:hypothetical protein K523DRAFT_356711 [Schizophyllum commune Tattone D]